MKRRTQHRLKRFGLHRLLRIALRDWEGDRGWKATGELHRRGSPETVQCVQGLSRHASWRRRALGMNVAAQLREGGNGEPYALEATQALLLAGLNDAHDGVISAAVSGLGHRPHPAALADLVRLASHPSSGVRFSVAYALGSYQEPAAVDALLALAKDMDDDVRDWATFGLGSLHDADTPAVRELLWRSLQDANVDVRGEALVGLAARGDPRAVDHLLRHLTEDCLVYELIAAEKLAARELLPSLELLLAGAAGPGLEAGWARHLLDAAQACGGQAPVNGA